MKTITERPILFSTPMVEAILAGRKTQTRRVADLSNWALDPDKPFKAAANPAVARAMSPYKVDRLWVRETHLFAAGFTYRPETPKKISPDGQCAFFRAGWPWGAVSKWRPSIFMPRWASRITLKVLGVRLERVQGISEDDAIAEGIDWKQVDNWTKSYLSGVDTYTHFTAKDAYRALWDSLNAKRGFGWDTNPWVWVIEFEVEGGQHGK